MLLALLKELMYSFMKIGSITLTILVALLIGIIMGIRMIFKRKKSTE